MISITLLIMMMVLIGTGIYWMTERSLTKVVLGIILIGNGINLMLLLMTGGPGLAPIFNPDVDPADYTDPLPQALILTAIVITFGTSAFLLALIYRSWRLSQGDNVTDDDEDAEIGDQDSTLGDVADIDAGDTEFGDLAESPIAGASGIGPGDDDDVDLFAPATFGGEIVPQTNPDSADSIVSEVDFDREKGDS